MYNWCKMDGYCFKLKDNYIHEYIQDNKWTGPVHMYWQMADSQVTGRLISIMKKINLEDGTEARGYRAINTGGIDIPMDDMWDGVIQYLPEIHDDYQLFVKDLLAEAHDKYCQGASFKSTITDHGDERVIQPYHRQSKMHYVFQVNTWGKQVIYCRGGMLTHGKFSSNPTIWKEGEWAPLINKQTNNKVMEYKMTPKQAQSIIDIACEDWKEKLAYKWAKDIVMGNNITVSETFYKEMRAACTLGQYILFDEIFGKDTKEVDLSSAKGKNVHSSNGFTTDSLPQNFIEIRNIEKFKNKAFFLSNNHNWELHRDFNDEMILIPTVK